MKYCTLIILLLSIFGCNNNEKSTTEKKTSFDTIVKQKDTVQLKAIEVNKDTAVLMLAKQILTSLKNKNYEQFAGFIHPVSGVRFSPYGHIDTTKDVKFSSLDFGKKISEKIKINWGNYDGTGDKIILTPQQYFKKFVYSADFLNAEKTSFNITPGSGNSLNNLETIYKDCDFTESYFSGFDKKYDGMDWCSLRLVFKSFNNKIYLVAIVHDQWTI